MRSKIRLKFKNKILRCSFRQFSMFCHCRILQKKEYFRQIYPPWQYKSWITKLSVINCARKLWKTIKKKHFLSQKLKKRPLISKTMHSPCYVQHHRRYWTYIWVSINGWFLILNSLKHTVQIVSVFGAILVFIFPHSDWIRSDAEYLSVFSSNAEKCGPE